MHPNVLLIGGSGLVGRAVLRLCAGSGIKVAAVTRAAAPEADVAGLARWHCGCDLDGIAGRLPDPAAIDAVIAAGPLDVLSYWLSRRPLPALRRVVALSSTSVKVKPDSPDVAERALAKRLAEGEARLVDACVDAGIAWTILRPTLIWGEGRDHNVSRLAALARRHGRLVLPRFARGRRQPVRAEDVALALLAALRSPGAAGLALDLPGGEALPYDEMAARVVRAVNPKARLRRIPLPAAAVRLAARLGVVPPALAAVLLRMGQDLVFDGQPAQAALGVAPRPFEPTENDFRPP